MRTHVQTQTCTYPHHGPTSWTHHHLRVPLVYRWLHMTQTCAIAAFTHSLDLFLTTHTHIPSHNATSLSHCRLLSFNPVWTSPLVHAVWFVESFDVWSAKDLQPYLDFVTVCGVSKVYRPMEEMRVCKGAFTLAVKSKSRSNSPENVVKWILFSTQGSQKIYYTGEQATSSSSQYFFRLWYTVTVSVWLPGSPIFFTKNINGSVWFSK